MRNWLAGSEFPMTVVWRMCSQTSVISTPAAVPRLPSGSWQGRGTGQEIWYRETIFHLRERASVQRAILRPADRVPDGMIGKRAGRLLESTSERVIQDSGQAVRDLLNAESHLRRTISNVRAVRRGTHLSAGFAPRPDWARPGCEYRSGTPLGHTARRGGTPVTGRQRWFLQAAPVAIDGRSASRLPFSDGLFELLALGARMTRD